MQSYKPVIVSSRLASIPKYLQSPCSLCVPAVDHAQEAIPANGDNVHQQHSVVQRYELEVDDLNERPHHPIGTQSLPVTLIQLVLRACTLHDRHAAQEAEQVCASEEELVACNSGDDLEVLVGKDDFVL